MLAGRFPASPDRVALGELTARSLHVHVGDDVAFDTGADGGRSPITSSASSCCPPCRSARAVAGAPP